LSNRGIRRSDPLQPQLAQAVAAVVQANPVGKPAGRLLHLQDVDQELAEFVGRARDPGEALGHLLRRPVGEQTAVMNANHRHAAARRAHHVVVITEDPEEPLGQRPRRIAHARVGHRLAAAGLGLGIVDLHTVPLEQIDGRQAHVRVALVDVARDEQAYLHVRPGIIAPAWRRDKPAGTCRATRRPGGAPHPRPPRTALDAARSAATRAAAHAPRRATAAHRVCPNGDLGYTAMSTAPLGHCDTR
jgi:hypothetical protein